MNGGGFCVVRYDLGKIGHEEFERMCQSMLMEIIGKGVSIFGSGKDGAREATYKGTADFPSSIEQWKGDWIFQVKYHDLSLIGVTASRKKIIEELENELVKITQKYKHSCDNYILLTNVPLSPVFQTGTKDKINNELIPKFSEYITNIYVIGAEEICGYLDCYPNIRSSFLQYITCGDILDTLLKNIEAKSNQLSDTIQSYCFKLLIKDEKHAVLDDAGDFEDKE